MIVRYDLHLGIKTLQARILPDAVGHMVAVGTIVKLDASPCPTHARLVALNERVEYGRDGRYWEMAKLAWAAPDVATRLREPDGLQHREEVG